MKQILSLLTLLVCVCSGAWADEGDEIYSNNFSTNDQTHFATWQAAAKVPTGYTYTQLGRLGTFSISTGALVNTPLTGGNNNGQTVANGNFGTFNSAITTATNSKNYVLSFDITLTIINHYAYSSIFEISGEDKKTILCLYATHSRTNSTTGSTSYGYIVGGNNAFATKDATVSTKTNTEGSWGDGTKHQIANVSETTGSKTYHVVLDAQTTGLAKLTITEGVTKVVDEDVSISADNGLKYIYLSNYNYDDSYVDHIPVSSITVDNLSIVEGAPTVAATADYTVKYVANIGGDETEIKSQAVRTGLVDATVNLTDADKNTIWYNDVKSLVSTKNQRRCL